MRQPAESSGILKAISGCTNLLWDFQKLFGLTIRTETRSIIREKIFGYASLSRMEEIRLSARTTPLGSREFRGANQEKSGLPAFASIIKRFTWEPSIPKKKPRKPTKRPHGKGSGSSLEYESTVQIRMRMGTENLVASNRNGCGKEGGEMGWKKRKRMRRGFVSPL